MAQECQQDRLLARTMNDKQTSFLVQKGEEQTVFDLANRLLNQSWDEVCFFDPYLLDEKGKDALVDWMRLLCGSSAKRVCAIYYRKSERQNTITLTEAGQLLSLDWTLSQELRRNSKSLRLVGLSEYIHDRFLLCREGSRFAGLALGTSINSLDSNYFCLHQLTPTFAQQCWETFKTLILSHTVESEIMRYD